MKSINTTTPKKEQLKQDWRLFDAKGKTLGRVASEIAVALLGKDKAIYSPHMNVGSKVVVLNASDVVFTGNKEDKKVYYRHSNYPGGLKSETLGSLHNRKPTEALRRAVQGMLPKNKLRKVRMANLYIYPGADHPHQGQVKA